MDRWPPLSVEKEEFVQAVQTELEKKTVDEDQEVRKVNETTGAEKGSKLARFDLIPVGPLTELAKHFGRGALKYEDRNWERGYEWSLSYAALQRHANAFWGGENIDPETGTPHIIAVAWHAFALCEYMETHPELDDRSEYQHVLMSEGS